jgi:hypothetical protein
MNNQKSLFVLVLFTAVGMAGLYVLLAYAYNQYQSYKASAAGALGGNLGGLLGALGGGK